MIRLASALRKDERGASIIELALVAPVFASFLIGMVDLSRAYSFRLGLEQVVQRSIEKVMQYQENTSTFDTISNETVNSAVAAGYTDVTSSSVVIDYWLECNGARQTDYNTTCPTGEIYRRFITVQVQSKFTPTFGTRFLPGANSDGTYTIHTRAGMRTQ